MKHITPELIIPECIDYTCDVCGDKVSIGGYMGTKDFCASCARKILEKIGPHVRPLEKCYYCCGSKIDKHEHYYNGTQDPCPNCQRKPQEIYI